MDGQDFEDPDGMGCAPAVRRGGSPTSPNAELTAVAFDLEGPEAAVLAVLEKLVNIDLRAFGPGYATRTGLHHMAVFVIRRGAGKVSTAGDALGCGVTVAMCWLRRWHVRRD